MRWTQPPIVPWTREATPACGLARCLILLSVSLLTGKATAADLSEVTTIYSCDAANTLLNELFRHSFTPDCQTYAFTQRDTGTYYEFNDLNDVYPNYRKMVRILDQAPGTYTVGPDIADSYWSAVHPTNRVALELLKGDRIALIVDAAQAVAHSPVATQSPLEKALIQRDLLQACYVFARTAQILRETGETAAAMRAQMALDSIAPILARYLLSERELRSLQQDFHLRYMRCRATPQSQPASLASSYLPTPVIAGAEMDGWYRMMFHADTNLHFLHFAGRSFISVWFRAPGLDKDQFYSYWDDIARRYGARVNLSAHVPRLPRGTETGLVRTFSVILDDLTIADSGIPEEVLVRLFKWDRAQPDSTTSDYKGTVHFQWKMSRQLLLAGRGSYGLKRILEEDPSFLGFYTDVPDTAQSYRDCITTMRYNCVMCHSEALYGSSTVFSLGRRRVNDIEEMFDGGAILRVASHPDRYEGVSDFYQLLKAALAAEPTARE